MAEPPLIRNRGEAIDYLMSEKGLDDATIHEIGFTCYKAWLTTSEHFPPSIDDGDMYWLLPNGRIVTTHVIGPSLAQEYERQYMEPFPYKAEEFQSGEA